MFFLTKKRKEKRGKQHTYLKHTSIIPTPQPNLNIILTFYNFTDMQKEKKERIIKEEEEEISPELDAEA